MAQRAAATKRAAEPVTEDVTPESESPDKPKRVRAADHLDAVFAVIREAGKDGIDLNGIKEATGLPYRVVHNVTWHLEGQPVPRKNDEDHGKLQNPEGRRVHRGEGRRVRYFPGKGDNVPPTAKKAAKKATKSAS